MRFWPVARHRPIAWYWPLALGTVLPGCQLVVGDIELPEVIIVDAQLPDMGDPDAEIDAQPPIDMDARVDAPPDYGPDRAIDMATDMPPVLPLDMAPDWQPDMAPDMGPPVQTPPDLTALAGVWHLYGARGTQRNLNTFTAALRIDEAGNATLTEVDSLDPLGGVETLFDPHPDGSARVSIHLFPRAGRLAGMMDPISGAAVFVNDAAQDEVTPTFVLGTRVSGVQELAVPLIYLNAQVEPMPGEGEGGTLVRPMAPAYTQRDRLEFEADGSTSRDENKSYSAQFTNLQRLVLAPPQDGGEDDREGYVLTPMAGGAGATGVYGPQGDPQELVLLWPATFETVFSPARYWCAINGLSGEGEHRTHSGYMELAPDGHMTWDDGSSATAELNGDLLQLSSPRNLFGHPGGFASVDAEQRGVMLVDYDGTTFRWGMGLCLNLDSTF